MADEKYPINYHILAEDFKDQDAGRDGFSQDQAAWLLDSLRAMCNAYDELVDETSTLLDNSIDYLTTLRDEGDGAISGMDDGAIQREANRMANVLVMARSAFMDHDLDTTPEVE